MSKATSFLAFAVGAAVGSAATWQFAKKRYEKIAQEEIDSVKEFYGKKPIPHEAVVDNGAKQAAEQAKEKPDIFQYTAMLQKSGYTGDSSADQGEEMSKQDVPYVISPEQFGEIDDYAKISLTYFLDGVLVDDDYELVEDVDKVIGLTSLNHFGEYEDDSVFVRNDRLKCDYEILLDQRNYQDVLKTMPHRVEV